MSSVHVIRTVVVSITAAFALIIATPATAQAGCWLGVFCSAAPPPPPPAACANGGDDDRDGVSDMGDPGCTSPNDQWEHDDPAPDLGPGASGVPTGKLLGFNSALGMWSARPVDGKYSGITPAQEVSLIKRVGGNAQRMFLGWRYHQTSRYGAHKNLVAADVQYEAMRTGNIKPVVGIFQAPGWAACSGLDFGCHQRAAKPGVSSAPTSKMIADYTWFITAISDRYPAAAIETWNEPNYRTFWQEGTFTDPWRMADMQCAAYDAIKRRSSSRIVLSPGLLFIEPQWSADGSGGGLLEFLVNMYSRMGRKCWDATSVHSFSGMNYDGANSAHARLMRLMRNVRKRFRDTTPVWITEMGATTTGGGTGDHAPFSWPDQAKIVSGSVSELLGAPDVGAVFVHTLRDGGTPGDWPGTTTYGFGALQDEHVAEPAPKPAYCALLARVAGTYPGC